MQLQTAESTNICICLFSLFAKTVMYNIHSKFHNATGKTERQLYAKYSYKLFKL